MPIYYLSLILFLAMGLWQSSPACADIRVGDKNPIVGKPTTLSVLDARKNPVSGAELVVTYHPFSTTEITRVAQMRTDSGGILSWTPQWAGLVVLTARLSNGNDKQGRPRYQIVASTTLGVKYQTLPLSGLVVFLVAGIFLFGGMAYGFRLAFSQDL